MTRWEPVRSRGAPSLRKKGQLMRASEIECYPATRSLGFEQKGTRA